MRSEQGNEKSGFLLAGAGLLLTILVVAGFGRSHRLLRSVMVSHCRGKRRGPGAFMRKTRSPPFPMSFPGGTPGGFGYGGSYRLVFTRPGCREAAVTEKITPLAREIPVNWELYRYELLLEVDPYAPGEEAGSGELVLNGKPVTPGRLQLPYGEYELEVGGAGIKPKTVAFFGSRHLVTF